MKTETRASFIPTAASTTLGEKAISLSLFAGVVVIFAYAILATAFASTLATIPLPAPGNAFATKAAFLNVPVSDEDANLIIANLNSYPISEYPALYDKISRFTPEQKKALLPVLAKICRAGVQPFRLPFNADGKTAGGLEINCYLGLWECTSPKNAFLRIVQVRWENAPSDVTKSELETLVRSGLSKRQIQGLECYLTNPVLGFVDKSITAQVKLAALGVLVRANPVF